MATSVLRAKDDFRRQLNRRGPSKSSRIRRSPRARGWRESNFERGGMLGGSPRFPLTTAWKATSRRLDVPLEARPLELLGELGGAGAPAPARPVARGKVEHLLDEILGEAHVRIAESDARSYVYGPIRASWNRPCRADPLHHQVPRCGSRGGTGRGRTRPPSRRGTRTTRRGRRPAGPESGEGEKPVTLVLAKKRSSKRSLSRSSAVVRPAVGGEARVPSRWRWARIWIACR